LTGFDIRTTVEDLLSVAEPAHTILGLPWYGRAWTTRGPEPFSSVRTQGRITPPSASLYRDAIGIARANGRGYDPVAESAWTVYVVRKPGCDGCPQTWRQVWYDDVDGFGAKVAFAREQGMRGVGMWALGYTGVYRGMWTVLELASGELVDTTPPEGEASLADGASGREQGLPVVRGNVTLRFQARDERGGSELAFVRVANEGTLDEDGALVNGSTWPATDSVEWSLEDGPVVVPPKTRPVRTPGPSGPPLLPDASPEVGISANPSSSASPAASGDPAPASADPAAASSPASAPPVLQSARTIFVQWRDVAGNWSAPVTVEVWYTPKGSLKPEPTPSPTPTPEPSVSAGHSPAPSEASVPAAPSPPASSAVPEGPVAS
jgi:hypothetical protein